jgi:hypothetical protein
MNMRHVHATLQKTQIGIQMALHNVEVMALCQSDIWQVHAKIEYAPANIYVRPGQLRELQQPHALPHGFPVRRTDRNHPRSVTASRLCSRYF